MFYKYSVFFLRANFDVLHGSKNPEKINKIDGFQLKEKKNEGIPLRSTNKSIGTERTKGVIKRMQLLNL